MHKTNAKQNFRSEDHIWVPLGELSLREFLSDHNRKEGPMAGFLFQMVRKLGMSPEYMEKITRTLAGFAEEALVHHKQGMLEFPGRIRIFSQKKIIDDVNLRKTSIPCHTNQDKKHAQSFPDSGMTMIAGWGYFMIEQGEDLLPHSSAIPHNYIDLYLYKEGE